MRNIILAAAAVTLFTSQAVAGVNPPGPGEEIVYQTSRTASKGISQITGNAFTEVGDEVLLGGTARYVTNIAVGTQTYDNPQTLEYQPAFVELTIYLNDGPPDPPGDGGAIESTPHNNPRPGTILGRSRVPGLRYPEFGTTREMADDFVMNFPFPHVLVPDDVTFAFVNLDENGNPDITYGINPPPNPNNWQQPSFRFGPYSVTASDTNDIPSEGGPFYNNTEFNSNTVGTSRTGPAPYTFANSGHWTWTEYIGLWESRRATNRATDATIIAAFAPVLGDMDGDGDRDNFDIQPFELALTNNSEYLATYPRLTDYGLRGDIDGDGDFDNFDIQPFEMLLTGGGGGSLPAVPEPATWCLMALGLGGLAIVGRRRRAG